jgi:cytochrome c
MLCSLLLLAVTGQAALPAPSLVAGPERPRDIWAFRSVLDRRPRVLTLALHKDLWVAYDATNCGLYRAWTGEVKFDGAVYTSTHGPQPTTLGNLHLPGIVDEPVWRLERNGAPVAVRPEFKGYRILNNQATLQYRFRLPDRREVWIYERPEVVGTAEGQVVLERLFRVEGLRPGEQIRLLMLLSPDDVRTNGRLTRVGSRQVAGRPFEEGTLWLGNGETHVRTIFNLVPEHMLSASLEGADPQTPPQQEPQKPPREPGLSMRVYWIGTSMDRIPRLLAGQTPNYSVVIPQVDLSGAKAFGTEPDHFYVHITGFLHAPTAGEYTFRLTSDDGSKLRINGRVVIDHDGLHGAVPMLGNVTLAAGEHPIEIEYFENTVDEMLKLEWRPPGASQFEVVPTLALSTPAGEVRVTSPGRKAIFDPAQRLRPGHGMPLADVHPSFDMATVRPRDFRPRVGGMDFFPDGRLAVCTWDADGAVYLLDGVQRPRPTAVAVKRVAAGLAEPLGLSIVDGDIYVLQKHELTRLRDLNGDGIIDEFFTVCDGWGVTWNFHEFAFGLLYDRNHFYANLAIAIDPGGRSTRNQNPDRGKVVKIAKNGDYSFVASGLRTPNGIGFGYNRQIFITDNQGDWLPSSKVVHLKEGAFYGSYAAEPKGAKLTEMPPVAWLPQGEIGNSPSQPAPLNVGPYRNQMIHGDVTHGGVKRIFVEEVDGVLQGSVFRFTQGLEAGINRLTWGPGGALYVGGIGSTGNWGQEGKERFGLQRLTYNGKPTYEMLAVRSKTNGMEIELTQPLLPGVGRHPGDYSVSTWRYVPTVEYGGPKIDERPLDVRSATVSNDRRRVFLELPDMHAGHVVYIRINGGLPSQTMEHLWTTEAWYTLNRIPRNAVVRVARDEQRPNTLSAQEAREGFKLLFDGSSLEQWRGYRRQEVPNGWRPVEGELRFEPGRSGGDLITKEQFESFDLRLDWKVSPGGNSGIFYRFTEEHAYPWMTGPEYQVLDDDLHPDGRSPLTSAASNYALHPRTRDVVRPAGQWNETRIVVRGNLVEHWLNNVKVVEYEFHSPEWKDLVAKSKFASMKDYGQRKQGHIGLQDHGNVVSFRNIRIRRL